MKLFKSAAVTVAVLSGLAIGIGSAFAQEAKYDWKACQSDIAKLCKDAKGDAKIGIKVSALAASLLGMVAALGLFSVMALGQLNEARSS